MKSSGCSGAYVGGTQGVPVPLFNEPRRIPRTPAREIPTGLDWSKHQASDAEPQDASDLRHNPAPVTLEQELVDLERTNPDVREASQRLADVIERIKRPQDHLQAPVEEPRKRRTRLTDEQQEEICRRYQAGESSGAIAGEYAVTAPAVILVLRRHGVTIRTRREARVLQAEHSKQATTC